MQANDIPLTSDNFIGVISPQAVQAGTTGNIAVSGFQNIKSALGGGIILQDKPSGFLKDVVAQASTFLGGNGTVDAGEIKLNLQIKLADMVQDASRLQPYGGGAEAKVTINGSLKNLKITESHEFGTTIGVPTNLKSMNFKIVGDMSAEAKISGGFVAELGYFSKAWAEVDQAALNLLGVAAQLSGLDSKDKQGKYPIAGLVFSVPCPTTCPVAPGTTQTPVRAAKMGGVIVWIYLNANGTLTAEGSMGVRINPGELSLGMQMPEGGKLNGIGDLKNKGTGLLLEAPFFEGKADLTARAGIAVDADFFAFGVRVGNAELFLGSQFNGSVTSTPSISYGATSLSAPWSWTGNACTTAVVGGGAVLSARANIGVLVSTDWGIASGSASYTSPEYGGQWPNEAELTAQGWHQILGLNSWYTAAASTQCYPIASNAFQVNPIAFQRIQNINGNELTSYESGLVLYMPTSTAYDNATVQGIGTENLVDGIAYLRDTGGASLQVVHLDGVASGEVLSLPTNMVAGYIPKGTVYTIKLYKGANLVSTQAVALPSAVISPANLSASLFPGITLRSYVALCPNDVATTANWFTIPSGLPTSPQNRLNCNSALSVTAAVESGDINNYRFASSYYGSKFLAPVAPTYVSEIVPIATQTTYGSVAGSNPSTSYETGLVVNVLKSPIGEYDNATISGLGTAGVGTGGVMKLEGTSLTRDGTVSPYFQLVGFMGAMAYNILPLPASLPSVDLPAGSQYVVKFYKGTTFVNSQVISTNAGALGSLEMTPYMFPKLTLNTYAQLCPNDLATQTNFYTLPSTLVQTLFAKVSRCGLISGMPGLPPQAAPDIEATDVFKRRFRALFYVAGP